MEKAPSPLESLKMLSKVKKDSTFNKNIYNDPKFKQTRSQKISGFKNIRPQNRGK